MHSSGIESGIELCINIRIFRAYQYYYPKQNNNEYTSQSEER